MPTLWQWAVAPIHTWQQVEFEKKQAYEQALEERLLRIKAREEAERKEWARQERATRYIQPRCSR